MFRKKILPTLAWLLYRIWSGSWRLMCHEPDSFKAALSENKPVIFAMWHGDELAMIAFSRYYRVATLTSTSRDGALMDTVLKRLGLATSRGSSTRDGIQALKGLVRLGKQGYIPVLPVDGPRGPVYKAKPGVFQLSRLLNCQIFPGGVACSSAISFKKSWNKAFFPKPFSKVALFLGDPIGPVCRDDNPRAEDLAKRLESALDNARQNAAELISGKTGGEENRRTFSEKPPESSP